MKDYPVERMMRIAKVTQVYEGANQFNVGGSSTIIKKSLKSNSTQAASKMSRCKAPEIPKK